jgi:putative tricarboxylic transport membrane protein
MSVSIRANEKRGRPSAGAVACAGLLALGAGPAAPEAAAASAWAPARPVELVVPSGTGGGNDRIARLMQQLMQQNKLVNVAATVVNKPGGGQAVTYAYLQQQAGDGHVLATATMNMLTNRIMGSNPLSYRDLTPIVQLTRYYLVFAVRADSPIRTFRDVTARLKSDPQSLAFGVSSGAFPPITVGMVGAASGVAPGKLKRVVFRSGGEVMTAILGGHVDIVAAAPTSILAQHRAGTVRIIGVTSPRRLGGAFAEVPTIREQGVDVVSANWYNIVAPPKVPAAQVAFWEGVFEKAVATPEWRKEIEDNAWDDSFLKGRELMKALQEQEKQLEEVLRAMGMAKQP